MREIVKTAILLKISHLKRWFLKTFSRKKTIDIVSERIVLGKKEQLHYCKPREEEEVQMQRDSFVVLNRPSSLIACISFLK